jgi:Zn-dependent protease with chaperone function
MKSHVCKKICETFKVEVDQCEQLEVIFSLINLEMKKKHLSHLVSAVEELINNKYKDNLINPTPSAIVDEREMIVRLLQKRTRRFSIILIQEPKLNGRAHVRHHNYGSIIAYNPNFNEKCNSRDIRILIAHELGHIVNRHLSGISDTQNCANIFAYLAIHGRHEFYNKDASDYTYNNESEIVDDISALCPISILNETSHDL